MVQLAAIMVGYRLASGEPDLTIAFTLIFFSGIILVVLSFLKVSKLIYYTPYSVVAGFMCGIGVIVMLLEFDSFLGLPAPHSVIEAIHDIPKAIMNASPYALAVSLPTLLILFLWPALGKKVPVLKRIPAPLIALFTGTAIANGFALDIEYIGNIPKGLPSLYLPDFSLFGTLFVPALSLAGLAVFDSLLTCIVADHMIGEKHSSDRETFGQGLANMAAGLIGGLTTATATMRTVANIKSGGQTPLASVVHGLILMALVLGLGFLAESIPMACLAAILIKVGIDILDYRILPVLHRLPPTDMIVFWVVLVVTIVEDLLVAMVVGVVLAFFRFVQEVSRVYKHEVIYLDNMENKLISDQVKSKIKVLKPQGPLFFGSIEPLGKSYQEATSHDILVIDLKGVTMIDLSGAYALEDLILKAQEEGKEIFICNASPQIDRVLRSVKIVEHIGERSYFMVEEDALVKAQEMELVKATEKQLADQMKVVLTTKENKEKLVDAANYAHDIVTDPEKSKFYHEHGDPHIAFSKAVEDYLIGPEIKKIDVIGYHGQVHFPLKCEVVDNYKVCNVVTTIYCDGEVLEKGKATHKSGDEWVFTTQLDNHCDGMLMVKFEATDQPGNLSMREVSIQHKKENFGIES
jgi:SulP family sulfate permease